MPDSDIILCILTTDKQASCMDYISKGWDIVLNNTQNTLLTSYEISSVNISYNPYKTSIVFNINNKVFTRLKSIYNSTESIISAFGDLDNNNKPIAHLASDTAIIKNTTDGALSNRIENQASITTNTNNQHIISNEKSLVSILYKKTITTISSGILAINMIFVILIAIILN